MSPLLTRCLEACFFFRHKMTILFTNADVIDADGICAKGDRAFLLISARVANLCCYPLALLHLILLYYEIIFLTNALTVLRIDGVMFTICI